MKNDLTLHSSSRLSRLNGGDSRVYLIYSCILRSLDSFILNNTFIKLSHIRLLFPFFGLVPPECAKGTLVLLLGIQHCRHLFRFADIQETALSIAFEYGAIHL